MELLFGIGCLFFFLILIAIVKYFSGQRSEIQFVKTRISTAGSWKELVYWKRELQTLRLSLIPGISPKRAKGLLNRFDRKKNSDGLRYMLVPSLLCLFICSFCLAGSTFAWFSAAEHTGTQSIRSAEYTVDCRVSVNGIGVLPQADGSFQLQTGVGYTLHLKGEGSAGRGYALLRYGTEKHNSPYHTQPILMGEEILIQIEPKNSSVLTVIGQWGTSSQIPQEGQADPRFFSYDQSGTVYAIKAPEEALSKEEQISPPSVSATAVSSSQPPRSTVAQSEAPGNTVPVTASQSSFSVSVSGTGPASTVPIQGSKV